MLPKVILMLFTILWIWLYLDRIGNRKDYLMLDNFGNFYLKNLSWFCHGMDRKKLYCWLWADTETVARRCSVKNGEGVFKKLAKFTEKHLCRSLIFTKVAGRACIIITNKTLTQTSVFMWIFRNIWENRLFYRTPPVAVSLDNCPLDHSKCTHHYQVFWKVF